MFHGYEPKFETKTDDMIIYNVTCNMPESLVSEWLNWIKEHIPQVLGTGCFIDARLTRVLVQEEDGSATFSVQYKAPDATTLEKYYNEYAPALRRETGERFGDQVLAFRTELELIDEYKVR